MELNDEVERIESREDLVAFMNSLRSEYGLRPDWWENRDLKSYLEALAGWTEDMDGYFRNHGLEPPLTPTWRVFGMMLIAATMYE